MFIATFNREHIKIYLDREKQMLREVLTPGLVLA